MCWHILGIRGGHGLVYFRICRVHGLVYFKNTRRAWVGVCKEYAKVMSWCNLGICGCQGLVYFRIT